MRKATAQTLTARGTVSTYAARLRRRSGARTPLANYSRPGASRLGREQSCPVGASSCVYLSSPIRQVLVLGLNEGAFAHCIDARERTTRTAQPRRRPLRVFLQRERENVFTLSALSNLVRGQSHERIWHNTARGREGQTGSCVSVWPGVQGGVAACAVGGAEL